MRAGRLFGMRRRCASSIPIRRRSSGSRSSGASCWIPTRASTISCSRPGAGRASSGSGSPCSWTASTSAAGGAGCSSSRCRRRATMGAGGFVVLLALALPAFRETADDDWLKKSELAVTFLDRYGNEIGSRGIKHNDSIPLSEFPGRADQGDARHRRPPLLRAFRHRPARHRARARHQHPGRRRAPGRLLDHPAARQEPVPHQRAHHRAQGQGGVPGAVAGIAADQERDPEAVSRPRLSRRRRVRRRRRGAVLLQQVARAT